MQKILFQGDSITDGNRYKDPASRWDLNHQIGHSYVYPIAGKLGYLYPGKYAIVNRGVSGDSVDSIARRWQEDTLDEEPDILSILLGINGNGTFDGAFPEGVDVHLAAFRDRYASLLTQAREKNPALKIILMEPFTLPCGQTKAHYDVFMPVFRQKQAIVRDLAMQFGAVFVPIQTELEALAERMADTLLKNGCSTDPYAYWLWDGVHPTEPCHWFLAEKWLETAAPLL